MEIKGRCACGGVKFEAHGDPVFQFICHCHSCRTAHAAAAIAIAVFPENNVKYTGETQRLTLTVTGRPDAVRRIVCTKCGTKVANEPGRGLRGIFPSLCEEQDWFKAQVHIHWQEHILQMTDDLPKFLDVPTDFGGTGKMA